MSFVATSDLICNLFTPNSSQLRRFSKIRMETSEVFSSLGQYLIHEPPKKHDRIIILAAAGNAEIEC